MLTLRGVYGNPLPRDFKNNLDAPAKPLELSPERGRFILTYSLVENRSFSFNRELANAAYPDVGYHDGRFYIFFAPGISLMATPFYLIGKLFNLSQVFSFAMISLFTIGDLILLYHISRNVFQLSERASLVSPLIFGFASESWPYANTLYQHNVTTFLMLSLFYASWQYKKTKEIVFPTVAWVCYAVAVAIDYPNAVLFIPLMGYFAWCARDKKTGFHWTFFLASILGIAIFIIHGYYNYIELGKWTRVNGTIVAYRTLEKNNLFGTEHIEEQVKLMEQGKSALQFFRLSRILNGISVLFVSPDRGLFFYYPIMLLGFYGFIRRFITLRLEKTILMSTIVLTVLLYSMWNDPWGGWAFGPRYLIPSCAFLSLFLAEWISKTKRTSLTNWIYWSTFVFSSAVALSGALTTNALPTRKEGLDLHSAYNYILNMQYILKNISSSFAYNELFQYILPLWGFYLAILAGVIICFSKIQSAKSH
jgi:hypothetical protein